MSNRRRQRGFEPAGALPIDRLGLPKARAREMVLVRVWNEVAGPALSAHAQALRLVRGTLEIEVEDGPWAETLTALLPGLTGRLSAARPELRVRKVRVLRSKAGAAPASAPTPRTEPAAGQGEWGERLPELARRYMARGQR